MKTSALILTILLAFCSSYAKGKKTKSPNLLIIHTDEHNLRTLGCYRQTMSDEQAFMWGENTIVNTPNIDRLASEGALCENWYATSPVCTPSRASMMTGLYPIATGSHRNDLPLHDHIVTFAEILKANGYATSYVGKWHLDGDAKPGFAPARQFGFSDNRYMFNRGHWKALAEDENGLHIDQKLTKSGKAIFDVEQVDEKSFTTDFIVDRSLDIIKRDKNQPFAIMLSIPDPHGPNQVRAPYDTMFDHMHFSDPRTMRPDTQNSPKWLKTEGNMQLNQAQMADYYGMTKCIDDNVGRILKFLEEEGLDDNTIVVFTSDHGDLMGEHGRHNKGLPYEMSARVAFLLKYPEQVKGGKRIQKACTMADFAPTILSLMGVDCAAYQFHGTDLASDFKAEEKLIVNDRVVYITNAYSRWVAAVNNRYKLVLTPNDSPWLFDLQEDPDELINYYNNPDYKDIAAWLMKELYNQMEAYDDPLLKLGTIVKK